MTCIATDGKEMAGDGRLCVGDLIINDRGVKVHHLPDGSVVGFAGKADDAALMLEWLRAGENHDVIPKVRDDTEALVLNTDGTADWIGGRLLTRVQWGVPAVIGSGTEIALAAMALGKSPKQAVELAARFATSCGGKITVLKPKKPR